MPMFDFRCRGGHVVERLVAHDVETVACSCGEVGHRVHGVYAAAVGRAPGRRISIKHALEADAEVKDSYRRVGMEPPDLAGAAQRHVAREKKAGA